MRSFLPVSTCLFLALTLVGCGVGSPKPMARGYSSYDKEFKSAPGAEARTVGYEYSSDKNETVLEDMRYAARDLVEKLDQKLSFSVDEVYLVNPANTAFYNSFDHLLRDEFTQQGYLLVSVPGDAVRVDLVVKDNTLSCVDNRNDGVYRSVYIALAIDAVKDVPTDLVSGFYEVPLYDHKDAGHMQIDVPPCSSECCRQE